ncbi:hypothetical protein GCM10023263_41390 [Phytohabitans rumicis]
MRLQQGVPIVDADWNELDDVRKFELRAFLKWYVGDGIPAGNDGFRVVGGLDNDFTIAAGVPPPPGGTSPAEAGLRHTGRIIVDGIDVIVAADVRYAAQPLHVSQPGAAALATRLGVPVAAALTTPGSAATLTAYLDVWERLITGDEEPDLVHSGLGVESCARMRREWVVRVRPGTAVPAPGQSDHIPGHIYYPLATLNRRGGVATIAVTDVADRRGRGLLLPPAHLIADTVGGDPLAYRRGENRPVVSLRDAINALIAGRLPSTSDLPVSPGTGNDVLRRAALLDSTGGLVVVWHSSRVSNINQVFAARLDLARPDSGFSAAVAVTSGTTANVEPTAVALPTGDLIVAYPTVVAGTTDVVMKRAALGGLPGVGTQNVAAVSGTSDQSPHAVLAGDRVVFLSHQGSTNQWTYRRYDHVATTFVDTAPVVLSTVTTTVRDLHAAASGSSVWAAFVEGTNLHGLRLNAADGTVGATTGPLALGAPADPFVLALSANDAMVFLDAGDNLRVISATGGAWGSATVIPGTDTNDTQPAAVRDADGTIYLFYQRLLSGSDNEIVLRRRPPIGSDWSPPQLVTRHAANDQRPHPVLVPGQGIWLVFMSNRTGNFDLYATQILTSI